MAKDPAFLFYSSDFIIGVAGLSYEDIGKYISLLCYMHQKGRLTLKKMEALVGDVSEDLLEKFDKDGRLYFNQRLEQEAERRRNYCNSRKNNKLGKNQHSKKTRSYDQHMENENENINNTVNTDSKKTKILLANRFENIWSKYPRKDGKKKAEGYFKSSVKTDEDWDNINKALGNYCDHVSDKEPQFIKAGKTWFHNWEDWVDWEEPLTPEDKKRTQDIEKQLRGMGL